MPGKSPIKNRSSVYKANTSKFSTPKKPNKSALDASDSLFTVAEEEKEPEVGIEHIRSSVINNVTVSPVKSMRKVIGKKKYTIK